MKKSNKKLVKKSPKSKQSKKINKKSKGKGDIRELVSQLEPTYNQLSELYTKFYDKYEDLYSLTHDELNYEIRNAYREKEELYKEINKLDSYVKDIVKKMQTMYNNIGRFQKGLNNVLTDAYL